MVASGNDFIVIDHRKPFIKTPKNFAKKVCDRHFGVGGDGLLLLEKSKKADIRMRIINADGSEAEMCGNGARCAALFAHKILGLGRKFRMETKAGIIHAAINAWTVEVQLTDPTAYAGPSELKLADCSLSYFFINTGVPHAVVILEEDFEDFPVAKIGREVRFHHAFQPAGTNVNFIRKTGARALAVRTYERGVEAETLACGTGSTASAIVAVLNRLVTSPVEVKTRSGEILKINFQKEGDLVSNVTLEGNAQFTFEGSLSDAI